MTMFPPGPPQPPYPPGPPQPYPSAGPSAANRPAPAAPYPAPGPAPVHPAGPPGAFGSPWGPPQPPPDLRARSLLLVAIGFSALVGLALGVDYLGPRVDRTGALGGMYLPLTPWYPPDAALGVIASWPAAIVVALSGLLWSRFGAHPGLRRRRVRITQAATAITLLAPFTVFIGGDLVHTFIPGCLLALPSTAFGLWLVHRMQRHHRIPFRLTLVAFGWGLLCTGFGGTMNVLISQIASNQFISRWAKGSMTPAHVADQLTVQQHIHLATFASAGLFEEAGKGAVLLLFYLAARHRLDPVSGIVLGAAAGLGFNLLESVEYMGQYNGLSAAYQYWARQSAGLMAAHVAFTAMTGAGFGIAAGLVRRRQRLAAIGCGYLAAAGGHFCTDVLMPFYAGKAQGWSLGPWLNTVVLTPGMIVATSGTFVVLYLLLLRRGLRDQAADLSVGASTEIATRSGALTPGDAAVLLSPRRRLQRRVIAFRLGGFDALGAMARMQNAQLDLAMAGGRRLRGRIDPHAPDEATLRATVLSLRHGTVPSAPQWRAPV